MTDQKTPTPSLLLVDGSSYLYRAFFAGGEAMSTTLPDGTVQKTGAIRIMINMMQKLLNEHEMGETFKVLALAPPASAEGWVPMGFATGDRSHRL